MGVINYILKDEQERLEALLRKYIMQMNDLHELEYEKIKEYNYLIRQIKKEIRELKIHFFVSKIIKFIV